VKLDLSLRFEMGYRTPFDPPRSTEEYMKCLTFLLKAAMTRALPCDTSDSRLAPLPYGFWTLKTPHTAEPIALNISSGLLRSLVTSLTEGYYLTRPCGLWELASRVNAKIVKLGLGIAAIALITAPPCFPVTPVTRIVFNISWVRTRISTAIYRDYGSKEYPLKMHD
jgi:hypothetical protein